LILRLTLPKAWVLDHDETKIAKPKTRIVAEIGFARERRMLTWKTILNSGMKRKIRGILRKWSGPFLLLRGDSSSGAFQR
jgi:hypothetical protein